MSTWPSVCLSCAMWHWLQSVLMSNWPLVCFSMPIWPPVCLLTSTSTWLPACLEICLAKSTSLNIRLVAAQPVSIYAWPSCLCLSDSKTFCLALQTWLMGISYPSLSLMSGKSTLSLFPPSRRLSASLSTPTSSVLFSLKKIFRHTCVRYSGVK